MFVVNVFIPTHDNDGHKFTDADFGAFVAFAVERFGGCSELPGTTKGAWVEDGRLYSDRNLTFQVFVGSIADGAMVGELADFAKRHFAQEAIAIQYLGQAEIL